MFHFVSKPLGTTIICCGYFLRYYIFVYILVWCSMYACVEHKVWRIYLEHSLLFSNIYSSAFGNCHCCADNPKISSSIICGQTGPRLGSLVHCFPLSTLLIIWKIYTFPNEQQIWQVRLLVLDVVDVVFLLLLDILGRVPPIRKDLWPPQNVIMLRAKTYKHRIRHMPCKGKWHMITMPSFLPGQIS